ncbi:mucin-5AC-like isoform X2 [Mercenaria mercenaria]|uniref:mucin-5AC-like isoform X2 n=1 Tax=Mercenaria mercenaria TaxID=6596 RepID=UPI00234E764D|nr:mucin-5AC-like isoform X2 [Mercenaria mercenaria]
MYLLVIVSNVVLLSAAANENVITQSMTSMPTNGQSSEMPTSGQFSEMSTTRQSSKMPTNGQFSEIPTTEQSSEKSSILPTSCPSGFVQCVDGKCEPFEALCGEGVTVSFPLEATTEMALSSSARPSATIDSSGESAVVTITNTLAATTPTVSVTTTPVIIATDSNGQEICLDGWELCLDGTCEPFHWLCAEHDGSANFTTIKTTQAPSTKAVETTPPIVTETMIKTTVLVPVGFPTDATTEIALSSSARPLVSGSAIVPQEITTSFPSGVTSVSGTCPSGFVLCVDGTCEPFEALCGEGGVVTVTFPTDLTTKGTVPSASGSPIPTMSTSESLAPSTTVPTTTTTFAVPTDSSGKEVCADGWEQCKDGTCEPFHWLCTEHDGSAPIIG